MRKFNLKRFLIAICSVLAFVFLPYLVGLIVINTLGLQTNTMLEIDVIGALWFFGFITIFIIFMALAILVLIGYGIYKLFLWIFFDSQ